MNDIVMFWIDKYFGGVPREKKLWKNILSKNANNEIVVVKRMKEKLLLKNESFKCWWIWNNIENGVILMGKGCNIIASNPPYIYLVIIFKL